ncbi:MBL fold metallo-hydrolase [Desulforegula conservatrix]|uniref:MBL fold metallo-hydrolase n=1 Tax=Desulforegula conservatrix TaxID=153026 RepID=UPI0003FAB145|nr:MBL fold metallo-hydrolase [Desulforegula conservatrix]
MLKEIKPGIFVITTKSRFPALKPPVNIYLLAGENALLFDAGYGLKSDVNYVKRHIDIAASNFLSKGKPFNLSWILPSHSHADHFSGATELKKMTGSNILLTDRMGKALKSRSTYIGNYYDIDNNAGLLEKWGSKFLNLIYEKSVGMKFIDKPDLTVEQGYKTYINGRTWELLHTPGHSSDHVGLYCENEGILLGGDNILRSVITWLGPPDSDLAEYENTLYETLSLPNLKIILPAHGSPVIRPKQRIREILFHRKKRLNDVLSIIKKTTSPGATLRSIQNRLYPGKGMVTRFNSEGWIKLSIKELIDSVKIKESQKGKKTFYTT